MEQVLRGAAAPSGVGPWTSPTDLYQAWLASRAARVDSPAPKTIQADARKVQRLEEVLIDSPERTIAEATTPAELRRRFWQGSWVTDDATPPYVPRAIDDDLRARLGQLVDTGEGGLVVVMGPPKAGKTRTLLEALRATAPNRLLWQLNASDGALDAVAQAVETEGGRRGAYDSDQVIVLIDDMQRHNFHTGAGITDKTLSRAFRRGLIVVATLHQDTFDGMRSFARDHTRTGLRESVALGASPDLIQMLTKAAVSLESELTADELSRVPGELAERPALQAAATRYTRLPEFLAAVDALYDRVLRGKSDADQPELAAILLAGHDAHHLHRNGASLAELEQLTRWAFLHLYPTRHWDPYLFLRAFDWATAPLGGTGSTHAILLPTTPGGSRYGLFDPLASRMHPWDPSRLTRYVDRLDPQICQPPSGLTSENQLVWATRWASSGDPHAMFLAGRLNEELGRFDAAEQWYLKMEAAEADSMSPIAPLLMPLGQMYAKRGMMLEAEQWFLYAAERNRDWSTALMLLIEAYRDQGDNEAAERWIRKAAHAGDPRSMLRLADVLRERGEVKESQRWTSRSILRGWGEARLSIYRVFQDQIEAGYPGPDGRGCLEDAADFGQPEAMDLLAGLHEAAGERNRAAELRARLVEPAALHDNLGRAAMHIKQKQYAQAEPWLAKAAAMGDVEAMAVLGSVCYLAKREAEAETWFRSAAEKGHAGAMARLGVIHQRRGETEVAEAWLHSAAQQDDPAAIKELAKLAQEPLDAERWWQRGVALFDTDSMIGLGLHYHREGHYEQALATLKKAARRDLEAAWLALWGVALEQGDETIADEWMEKAAKRGIPEALALAGWSARDKGDDETALEWWAKLTALEGPGVGPAMAVLGGLFVDAGDSDKGEMWLLLASNLDDTDAMRRLADLYTSRGELELGAHWRTCAEQPSDEAP